jgi:hypothetical protein
MTEAPKLREFHRNPLHADLGNELLAVVGKYNGPLGGEEIVALFANALGRLAGLQEIAMPAEMVTQLIMKNIEQGRADSRDKLKELNGQGRA